MTSSQTNSPVNKAVVITGSSRGIGLGLAMRFLEAGCHVVVNGSSDESTTCALESLKRFGEQVAGFAADVSTPEGVETLFDFAERSFGHVDIWINNAGIAHRQLPAWQLGVDEIARVLSLNINGVVNGTLIPFRRMQNAGGGLIMNMEGLGSDGFMLAGMTIYGTTKSAVTYFTRALAKEASHSKVRIGAISPGMVVTDMLRETVTGNSADAAKRRRFFNIMADDVETISAFVCKQILASTADSPRIVWLTKLRIIFKMLTASFRRRDFFA
jgi:NAD(P)-dependent dehydrogenase (short-subunit alcohol dehydrogenase family)